MLSWLTQIVLGITSSNILGAILLGFFIIIISEILEIPLAIYSTFVIEEKYGFNKTTKKTFVTDIIKNLIISSVISCSIYAVVIGIIENLGSNWWIFAFGAVFSIQLIIFFLYPVLIMPLFNKFEPLDDEQFKKPIEKLLEKVKFKAKGLFVMNASLRGHELGHYKLGHIRKSLISSLVFGFIGFYILSEVFKSENFFVSHGLIEITLYSKFILFYLVAGTYTFFTRPITSYLSRQREFAADDFSFKYTDGKYMISGLMKLSKDNASNLTPDPLYSSYYYSHMSTADEIKKLNDLLKERVITQEEFDLQKEKLLNSSTTTSTTDWLTLFLLTFFVGVLGVHRFYVGKIGTGFLMLLTLGGLGVWFLVDLILVVTGQFTNKDGQKIPRT